MKFEKIPEEISQEQIDEYFDKFIKPHILEETQHAMLLPYVPIEILKEWYGDGEELEYLKKIKKLNKIK